MSAVVELRRYALHPGARDTLIALFDRELVETQEAVGIRVIAQFRDVDRPDVFVWLRGFRDLASRAPALGAFYGGPAWAEHRDAANATMVAWDDVRLLRPAGPGTGFTPGARAATGATAVPPGLVVATIHAVRPEHAAEFPAFFAGTVAPRLAAAGARPLAALETDPAPNDYPALPVREGEHAFVTFHRFDDVAAHDRHVAALAGDPAWRDEVLPALARRLAAPAEVWRLTPTARSRALG